MTINLSTLASAALTGPIGPAGSNGISVSSVSLSNANLVITYSNTASYNVGTVVGINSTTVLANGSLYITYSNNATANAGYVQGTQGIQGPPGTLLNSSGALANSVTIANSTGYTTNTSNLLFFQSNNTLYVANTIAVNNLVYASNGAPISTGGGGGFAGSTFSGTIGDGTNTKYQVVHNLNKTNIITVVRETASGNIVYPSLQYSNTNQMNVTFVSAPATNFYTVSILGF